MLNEMHLQKNRICFDVTFVCDAAIANGEPFASFQIAIRRCPRSFFPDRP